MSIPLIKTDFSIGRSIIQMGRVSDSVHNTPDQPDNIQDILEDYKWDKLFLVEDDLGGFVPGYLAAQKAGAQLIYGWRISLVEDGAKKEKQPSSKAIIFVKSEKGWKKLVKIATKAQIDYFFEGARMDWKTLQELWCDELVLAIPHFDGFIHKNLCSKEQSIPDFGRIKPYLFFEDCDLPFDGIIRRKSEEYAAAYGLKTLNVKTCYYKNRSDLVYFQSRKLMDRKTFGSGGTIDEPNMEFFCSAEFSLESWEEKKDVVTEGENCFIKEFEKPLELFMPGVRLPEFIIEEDDKKFYNIPKKATDSEILRILARQGYRDKMERGEINKEKAKEYGERVEREIKVFEDTHFVPYILLVWSVMRFVRKNGLAHGFGRGSSAGSMVNWLLGITDIDPLANDLFFERFISTTRVKTNVVDGINYAQGALMDVDLDMSGTAREKVIEYLNSKYPNKFAKLATYNTKTTKALLKDAGKVIGCMSEDQIKIYSDEVPVKFGKVAKPEKALEESEKLRDFSENNPLIFGCVKKLQGIVSNFSSHASAYIVSYHPLDNFIPLQYGTDQEIITCFDANVTEKMVIKLDLLGLQSVELLSNVVKSVNIDPSKINYESWDDIYVHLQNLETPSNLFQISGDAAVRGLNKIKPRDPDALSNVLAICRPGSFVFMDTYADFYNGKTEKTSLHPLFDKILSKSGGVLLFQEELMEMCRAIGFSLTEADDIRRIVGKKKTEEIAEWEEKIYKKGEENGIDRRACEVLWKAALASSDYSFCKCLSPETLVEKENGQIMIKDIKPGDKIKAYDTKRKRIHFVEVVDLYESEAELYEFELEDGKKISASMDHKFLCDDGEMTPLRKIIENNKKIISI